jgi:hypothetical protein
VVSGNFCSHSVVIKILSNFSYVGFSLVFVHVYFLPDIWISLKFKPSNDCVKKGRPSVFVVGIIIFVGTS